MGGEQPATRRRNDPVRDERLAGAGDQSQNHTAKSVSALYHYPVALGVLTRLLLGDLGSNMVHVELLGLADNLL